MDFWAAFLHGRLWHGPWWAWHRSHHTARKGFWEKNDAFSLLHAPLSMAVTIWGSWEPAVPSVPRSIGFGIGIGMALFGLAYIIVHDGVVHGRLPLRFMARWPVLRGIVRAHRVHHTGTRGGAPYGLFFGAWELRRSLRSQHGASDGHTPAGRAAES
jgi:beta-carotene 3-hydroxylase